MDVGCVVGECGGQDPVPAAEVEDCVCVVSGWGEVKGEGKYRWVEGRGGRRLVWLGGGRRVLLCRCRLRGSSCFLERLVLPWLCGIWGGGFCALWSYGGYGRA